MGKGGMPGNLQNLMKQAQKVQKDLQVAQEKAKDITAEATAGGGMVKVVANGNNNLVSAVVDQEVLKDGDAEMVADLFIAAANEALNKVQEKVQEEVSKITGGLSSGLGIPGM